MLALGAQSPVQACHTSHLNLSHHTVDSARHRKKTQSLYGKLPFDVLGVGRVDSSDIRIANGESVAILPLPSGKRFRRLRKRIP